MRFCIVVSALTFTLIFRSASAGDDVRVLSEKIDQLIQQPLAGASPSPLVNESAFIRRVTLDLAGRIPTIAELDRFRSSESLDKRAELVASLIESPDFAFHQRNELDLLLLRRIKRDDQWREYLLEAAQENRPWDQLFREVILPEVVHPDDTRPSAFLASRLNDIDSMTNDSSILWFGVNVACAKCHDHPLVADWTQAHYYGLASFFKRTYRTRKGMLGERFDGMIKYETTDGEQLDSHFMFLNGAMVDEPGHGLDDETLKKHQESIQKAEREDEAEPPPSPEFRPREKLVDLALHDEQSFFARNIANRVWARLFGRGLVHPLDQIHSENPASHPELLDLLADNLHASGYDLKKLVHAIALSDTYARQMQMTDPSAPESDNTTPPDDPSLFASALPRPLTPYQMALSLKVATMGPSEMVGLPAGEDWNQQRESLERQVDHVANRLEIPDDNFQVPVSEALWMNNNAHVQNDYLNRGQNRLVGHLAQINDDTQAIQVAYQSVLSRDPSQAEQSSMSDYLQTHADRREPAIGDLVWALLTSPEFRFNH